MSSGLELSPVSSEKCTENVPQKTDYGSFGGGGKQEGSATGEGGAGGSATPNAPWQRRKRDYVILALVCCVTFLGKSERSLMAPFYPVYATSMNVTEFGVGVVFGSFDLTIWLSSLLWVAVLARVGARITFAAGIIGTSVFSALFATLEAAQDANVFLSVSILLRVLMGVFCSAYLVSETSILIAIFPNRVGAVMGLMTSLGGVAGMLGPLIGATFFQLGGFSLPFLALPSLIITLGIVSVFLLPDVSKQESVQQSRGSMCRMLSLPVFTVSLSFLVFSSAICGLNVVLLSIRLQQYNLSPVQNGLVFLSCPVFYMLFAPLAGYIVDKKPGWNISQMVLMFMLGGVFLTLLGPAPFYHIDEPPLWLLIFSYAMLGVCSTGVVTTVSLMLRTVREHGWQDSLDTNGSVAGFFHSSVSIGAASGSMLGGLVHGIVGWPWLLTGCGFTAWGLALLLIFAALYQNYVKGISCCPQNKGEDEQLLDECSQNP